jgi:putative transcriptional regulator
MIHIIPKKGNLLIAEPTILGDISFNRSIILLADHTEEGSIGFILNKPLDYTISDLLPEIEKPLRVYNGGPVEQDNLYFIHKIPELIPESIEISNGMFWGGDFRSVIKLINDGELILVGMLINWQPNSSQILGLLQKIFIKIQLLKKVMLPSGKKKC